MPVTASPLRYPGGKSKLYKEIKNIIDINNLHGTYIEPFAGGAGLAIKLLLSKDVKRIVINDSDPAIYAFWYSVLNYTNGLCTFVQSVKIDLDSWEKMREIYFNQSKHSVLEVGCATLFLNRVNRSGVIKGGLIGGKNQSGQYKMNARFNRTELINKIKLIAKESAHIDLYNLDVLDFLSPTVMKHYHNVFINFDPPYVEKGGQLYMNFFSKDDHKKLEKAISKLKRPWIVTYDNCDLIKTLYNSYRGGYLDVTYSANISRKSCELIYFSNGLIIPSFIKRV